MRPLAAVSALTLALVLVSIAPRTSSADDPSLYVVETVHSVLDPTVAIRFAPDGRMFFLELWTGRIRYFPDTTTASTPRTWATLPVAFGPEKGLVGIAFHPQFADSPWVYLFHTLPGGPVGDYNRIVRMRDSAGVGTQLTVIRDLGTGTNHHNGGRLEFGPDGYLYVTHGDADTISNADNPNVIRGKILRLTTMGQAAPGNPFGPGNPVVAYGIRNSFGLCFDSVTGNGYFTDNGPSCDDEVNYFQMGADYGWGVGDVCGSQPAGTMLPMLNYSPTIAPTGAWVYRGSRVPSLRGNLFFCGFNDFILRRAFINPVNPAVVDSVQNLWEAPNQLLDVTEGPDGYLWVLSTFEMYRVRLNLLVDVPEGAGGARTLAAWPNPFGSRVTFSLAGRGSLRRLDILDLAGRLVRHWDLPAAAGLIWDGRDSGGRSLAAGVYLVRATSSSGEVLTRRVVKVDR